MSSDYRLARGPHATPEEGRCAMEWVSHLAGEPHSDRPACVSPVLRALCIALNDGLDKHQRQRLRPYLGRTIGTAEDGLDDARAWMAMDWLIRVYTPGWLALAGVIEAADALASLEAVQDEPALAAALNALKLARRDARAALRTARVARALPSAAGWSARNAAWASAEGAVWAVARGAVAGSSGQRACAAARAAAGDAAAAAARQSRARFKRAGAAAAARAAITPTIVALQQSAIVLLERMLPTETLVPSLVPAGPRETGPEGAWSRPVSPGT